MTAAAAQPLRVTVWQEHRQDKTDPEVITNAVRWAAPSGGPIPPFEQRRPAVEQFDG